MAEKGFIRTSVSLTPILWDEIQAQISKEEMSFSRWVQKASRLMLKDLKHRKVKEFYNSLDENEKEILNKEIKKRS